MRVQSLKVYGVESCAKRVLNQISRHKLTVDKTSFGCSPLRDREGIADLELIIVFR